MSEARGQMTLGEVLRGVGERFTGFFREKTVCPICANKFILDLNIQSREMAICRRCGSTGRSSAIVHHLSRALSGDARPLCHQPVRKNLRIVGLSDWEVYAIPLAEKFDYTNTFYHQEPFLDIRKPAPAWRSSFDALISSDVFEHVVGSSEAAFKGAYFLLRAGGSMIFSVPYKLDGETTEHYTGLKTYDVKKLPDGRLAVDLEFDDGRKEVDENAIFHGGDGATLEVRLFSRSGIEREMKSAGFVDIQFHDENLPQHGINWKPWSRIVTARKPMHE